MNESCELCGDVGTLHLHGRCHPTAPLRMTLDDGELSVYCYVPTCNRLVARFSVEAMVDPFAQTPLERDIRYANPGLPRTEPPE